MTGDPLRPTGLAPASASSPSPVDPQKFQSALEAINDHMKGRRQLRGWLDDGELLLVTGTVAYFERLGKASIDAAAKRAGASAVDLCDVEKAQDKLSTTRQQAFATWLALACLLGGAVFTLLITLLLTPPQTNSWLWWSLFGLLGSFTVVTGCLAYKYR